MDTVDHNQGSLETRVSAALKRAAKQGLIPADELGSHESQHFDDLLEDVIESAFESLRAQIGERNSAAELLTTVAEIQALRSEVSMQRISQRLDVLAGVQQGLGRLRKAESVAAIMDAATTELCRSCGFDRSILFRVTNSEMIAESAYSRDDPEWAPYMIEVSRSNPARVDHLLLETEMVRRRGPVLVLDPAGDPRTFKPLIDAAKTTSYVAAPIMPEGRVVGFLHADRHASGRRVDALDRDVIWAFAEGFGYAFERTALLERMHARRTELSDLLTSASALIADLQETEIQLVRSKDERVHASRAVIVAAGRSGTDAMLTRREVEVLELMAEGSTNAAIGDRLVIAEGTVKSHVKRILRKLSASNRAEAVSKYLTAEMRPRDD